jgi:hypothetical protein
LRQALGLGARDEKPQHDDCSDGASMTTGLVVRAALLAALLAICAACTTVKSAGAGVVEGRSESTLLIYGLAELAGAFALR